MRLALLSNVLAPYRVPLFAELARGVRELRVFLMAKAHSHRQWQLPPVPFATEVLPGTSLWLPGGPEPVHLNYGVGRALGRWQPDVILSGGFGPANVQAFLHSRRRCAHVTWGELTLNEPRDRNPAALALRRWIVRGSEGCIASSSLARQAFLRYGAAPDRVSVSVMPVDAGMFRDAADRFRGSAGFHDFRNRYSAPLILVVGQLVDRKGFPELWPAYERLLAHLPSATLLIVGSGRQREEYEALVRSRGWQQVHFLGHLDAEALAACYAAADLFVFPTRHDPFGAVLGEALAAGTPVVTSVHAAATNDLVVHGDSGFAVDPGDTRAFAAAMLAALEQSPAARERMLALGRASVMRHDFRAAAAEMLAALRAADARARQALPAKA